MKRIHSDIRKVHIPCSIPSYVGAFLVLLFVLAQGHCVAAGVLGQSYYASGLKAEVTAGYKGIIRLGRDFSIYITIESTNSDFAGTVAIRIPDSEGDTTSYSKEIELEKSQKKCYVFTVPVTNDWSSIVVDINDHNNGRLFYQEYDLEIKKDMESPYLGILSENPENLSYLQQENDNVYTIEPESLHSTMSDWNQFDVIIVDDYNLDDLQVDLFRNLMKWTEQGGTLALGTGEAYQKTMSRLNKEGFLKTEYDGATQSKTLLGMSASDLAELRHTTGKVGLSENRIRAEIANFRVDGSQILRRDTIPLVESVSYGKGTILAYHIKLGDPQFTKHILAVDISQMIVGQFGIQRQELLNYRMYDSNVSGYCMNVVKKSDEIEVPSIWGYVITVILYLLLSGPVLYLVLSKLGKRKYIWGVLPATTILFLGIEFIGGKGSRLKDVQSSYFNMLYYNQDKIEEYSVFNLTVPYYDHFSIDFDTGTNLEAINEPGYGYFVDTLKAGTPASIQEEKREINEGVKKTSILLQDMTPYSSKYFTGKKTYDADGSYQSKLHFSVDGFSGSFTNHLGCDMNASFLISSGSIVSLGKIADGQQTDIPEKAGKPLLSCDYTMISDYVEEALGESEVNQNLSFEMSGAVNFIVQQYFNGDRSKSYIITFAHNKDQNSIVNTLTKQTRSLGVEMMILPVEVDYRNGDQEIVPNLDTNFTSIEGSYALGDVYRYFTGTLIVEYRLPENDRITSLYFSDYLNQEFDLTTFSGFSGTISLFNRNTKNYDEVFGADQNTVSDLTDYLSSDNTIIIKYREKNNLMDYYMTIPYISYYKEVE